LGRGDPSRALKHTEQQNEDQSNGKKGGRLEAEPHKEIAIELWARRLLLRANTWA
jgi:hypothetical protein